MSSSNDSRELRRCVRDLLALTALPAYWSRADFSAVADGLADVVLRSVPASFVYVQVIGESAAVTHRAVRTREGALDNCRVEEFSRSLDVLVPKASYTTLPNVNSPLGDGTVNVAINPIGFEGDSGYVVVGSDRSGFPGQIDMLLLNAAANQAAIVLQHRRAEASLHASEEALREASRRKDEFLAMLAHELRNPLAPIRNGLQLIRMAGGNGAILEQARSMMDRQLQQMVRLIDDLLDVSRITRGKLELRKEWVELAAVIQSAVETSRPLVETAGHELSVTFPPEPIYLEADQTRLAQVFSNLLNNAAKYTDRGGHISLTAERAGSNAVIKVRDNGVGIPADMVNHIFELFIQVDHSLEKRHGGLGIGLTLVKRLVEMHGGTIQACSDGPGCGSEFIVSLPVAPSVYRPTPSNHNANRAVSVTQRRLLVADDNRDAAKSLALLLTLAGNEVHTAFDGEQAIAVAVKLQPDVVLLDIGMPGLNGYDVARRIREQTWGKQAMLIALTGWGQPDDKQRALIAGFDHHMTKPVDPSALQELLAAHRPNDHSNHRPISD